MKNEEPTRLEIATAAMTVLLDNQGRHRRMTILNRIKWCLGLNTWSADYDYNFPAIAKNSFMLADEMLKQKDK